MPTFIIILLTAILSLSVLWWWRTDRRLRRANLVRSRFFIAAFVMFALSGFALTLLSRAGLDWLNDYTPKFVSAAFLLWSLLVLPIAILLLGATGLYVIVANYFSRRRPQHSPNHRK